MSNNKNNEVIKVRDGFSKTVVTSFATPDSEIVSILCDGRNIVATDKAGNYGLYSDPEGKYVKK